MGKREMHNMMMSTGGRSLLVVGLASVSFGSTAIADLEACATCFGFPYDGQPDDCLDFVRVTNLVVEGFHEDDTLLLPDAIRFADVSVRDDSWADLLEFNSIMPTESERFAADFVVFGASYDRGDVRIEPLTGIDW
ncbi:hypothetical protein OAR33_00145 [bacterium]|jgi:hypothetical protein|nr:hypothetical protein [bacterium]